MKDIRGLKGTFLGYLYELEKGNIITSDKVNDLVDIFNKINLSDCNNKDIDMLDTYVRDCRKNNKYDEAKLTDLLNRCAKIQKAQPTNNLPINGVMDLIREIVKLNPNVKFSLDNANTINQKLI